MIRWRRLRRKAQRVADTREEKPIHRLFAPRPRRNCVVLVGSFPPPVHGMSVAFDALAATLEQQTAILRLRTSPNGLRRSPTYHIVRVMRVLNALVRICLVRNHARQMFVSVDAGLGIAYDIAIALLASALRYQVYFQHHSYAYLSRRSALMAVMTRCGKRSTHLCSCPQMAADLHRLYPGVHRTIVVPVSYVLDAGQQAARRERGSGPIRLGLFGNLTMEKGICVAIEVARKANQHDLDVELYLAGPVIGRRAEEVLADAMASKTARVTYLGPIYGVARADYLRTLDVLLFPSTYANESFGLAAWEALSVGTPIFAFRAGCLTQEAVGGGGMILERNEDFVARALAELCRAADDPSALAAMQVKAARIAAESRRSAHAALSSLVTSVTADQADTSARTRP